MHGTGSVTACDLTPVKTDLIRENIRRTGCGNVEVKLSDATVYVPEWEEAYDLVIADLPCSGLGVIGRKPEIRFLVQPEDLKKLQMLQREILRNAVRYVKPGGILMYSTCTVTAEENTENQRWIREHLGLKPVPLTPVLPAALKEERTAGEGWLQLLPGIHPCDGFFLAKFRKEGMV